MKERPIILFAGDHAWKFARGDSLVEVPSSDSGNPSQVAQAIAALIDGSTSPVTLAVPASWCLSATVSLVGVPAKNRRNALLYRLELLLPLAAEDIAADYILNEPDSALAICVAVPTVKPLVDALEAAGVNVRSIIPASIYAAAWLLNVRLSEPCDLLIWQSPGSLEIFNIRAGLITGWYTAPSTVADLDWYFDQQSPAENASRRIIACSLEPELMRYLNSRKLSITSTREDEVNAVVASAMAAGFESPIEFRRDGLALGDGFRTIGKPIREFLAAALVLLMCVCIAGFWRAARLAAVADNDRVEQQKLFRDAFPGRGVPPNILGRLRSEERSLKGGGSAGERALVLKSALPTFQDILTGIGAVGSEVRLELDDLKIGDEQFSLDGVVRNRADLTGIVESLRRQSNLKLDPPLTEQMGGQGLHIVLTGSRVVGAIQK